jgi:hypothetical protein
MLKDENINKRCNLVTALFAYSMRHMKPGELVLAHASGIETEPSLLRRIEPILHRACIVREIVGDQALVTRFPEVADETPVAVPIELLLAVQNDVVPRKEGKRRALIYLDQCVLSELVKFKAGRLSGAHAEAARELLVALDEAVFEKQTAICVESSFHRQESSGLAPGARGGDDLLQATFEFLCMRSRHLRLLEHREILRGQALQQVALATNATVLPAKYLWKTGLSRDPDETNAKTGMFGGQIVVGVPWQRVDSPPMLAVGLERARAQGRFGDFAAELETCKRSLRTEALDLHKWQPWQQYWAEDGGGISNSAVADFLASEAFFDLPYNYCAARLTASLLSEKTRRFRDSDYVDLRFVARALPYSDLMLVDADLKNRIQSQKLDQRFSTHVLSAKLADYSEAATWLRTRSAAG